jgi:RNA polymerase sigma-70 factor (ECF subfamily)
VEFTGTRLYAFVRRQGYNPDEAQDLTQAFFTRLLEKHYLRDYERQRGRFRSFLLTALKHFLANERDGARAQKRGSGIPSFSFDDVIQKGERWYSLEPHSDLTPERVFERQWARTLLQHVLSRLKEESVRAGKEDQSDRLRGFPTGDHGGISYNIFTADYAVADGRFLINTAHESPPLPVSAGSGKAFSSITVIFNWAAGLKSRTTPNGDLKPASGLQK